MKVNNLVRAPWIYFFVNTQQIKEIKLSSKIQISLKHFNLMESD